jgi:hypothetical protein
MLVRLKGTPARQLESGILESPVALCADEPRLLGAIAEAAEVVIELSAWQPTCSIDDALMLATRTEPVAAVPGYSEVQGLAELAERAALDRKTIRNQRHHLRETAPHDAIARWIQRSPASPAPPLHRAVIVRVRWRRTSESGGRNGGAAITRVEVVNPRKGRLVLKSPDTLDAVV